MNIWGHTDAGRVRSSNQDAYYFELLDDGTRALIVVCDGMGGAKAGNIASTLATKAYAEHFKTRYRAGMTARALESLMKDVLSLTNSDVYNKAKSDENYEGMGTTLVAAVVSAVGTTIVNVGDSRAYLIDNDGINRVTRDHSLVEDMLQHGEITELEAKEHPSKNLITRAVGTDAQVQGDVYSLKPSCGSYLLFCTDGLSNLVTEQEMLYEGRVTRVLSG
ncbi:MAG: protein phosphatase 2C domain-containing protein [Clostridia bacterium]